MNAYEAAEMAYVDTCRERHGDIGPVDKIAMQAAVDASFLLALECFLSGDEARDIAGCYGFGTAEGDACLEALLRLAARLTNGGEEHP